MRPPPGTSWPLPLIRLARVQFADREGKRLRRGYPKPEEGHVEWIVTVSLARAFLHVDAADLALAMGSWSVAEQPADQAADYLARTAADVLDLVGEDRVPADG